MHVGRLDPADTADRLALKFADLTVPVSVPYSIARGVVGRA